MPFKNLAKIKIAAQQINEGQAVIWNARLDALAKTGDIKGFLDLLDVAADNGNCTCNCGTPGSLTDIINPASYPVNR